MANKAYIVPLKPTDEQRSLLAQTTGQPAGCGIICSLTTKLPNYDLRRKKFTSSKEK